MRRLKVLGFTAWLSSLAYAAALHGCAQSQGDGNPLATDGGPDAPHPDATRLVDGGRDVTLHAEAGKPDAGVDSTFGFDAYIPPNKDSGHDSGHDTGHDAPFDAGVDSGFDAGIDGGHDAGFLVYFGPPGSPCTREGTLQAQACGVCGTQESTCIVMPDGGVHLVDAGVDAGHGHHPGPHHDGGHAQDSAAEDAGPDLVWGEFSACAGQIDGGCVPGTAKNVTCGICGTQKIVCEPDCEYAATNCTGQVDGGCVPGSFVFDIVAACEADGGLPTDSGSHHHHHDSATPGPGPHPGPPDTGTQPDTGAADGDVDGGAPDAGSPDAPGSDTGTVDAAAHDATEGTDGPRAEAGHDASLDSGVDAPPVASPIVAGNAEVCNNSCEWKTSAACELPPSTLTIASQPTGKVTTIVNFSATQQTHRLGLTDFSGCPTTVQLIETPYGFVTVNNSSTTQMALVSAWSWQVPGAIAVPTYITAYATTPVTPADFAQCMVQVTETCDDENDPTSCLGMYGGLMLTDGNPIPIPAGGSIVLFLQDQKNFASTIGPVEVTIRTESFE